MSRSSFTEARTGRKAYKGNSGSQNDVLEKLSYEVGDNKRIVIPMHEGSVIVFSTPVHSVLNGNVRMPKKVGTYPVNEIRCTHVSSQFTDSDSLEIAKRRETCVFCDIARLEGRKQWDIISSQYGDSFKEMSKDEKKAIFTDIQKDFTVENAFRSNRDEDGNSTLEINKVSYLLILELEATTDGKTVTVDSKGMPKFTPRLLPFTKARIDKFKNAISNGLDLFTIKVENLTPYKEHEGTDMEEEVTTGWIDYTLKFPGNPSKVSKMVSARDLAINATPAQSSVISDEFIEAVTPLLDKYIKDADFTTTKYFKNLVDVNREVAMEYIADRTDEDGNVISGEDYYLDLEAKYARNETIVKEDGTEIPSDEAKAQQNFDRVIERLDVEQPVEATVKTSVEPSNDVTVVDETPKEEEPKKTPRTVVKKRTTEPVVEEDAFDGEYDF